MPFIKPCPNCQNPLDIPQPPPPMIVCPKCGVTIKRKAPKVGVPDTPSAEFATATPPNASPASPRRFLLVFGLLGCLMLLGCVPICGIGIAWYINEAGTKAKSVEPVKVDAAPTPVVNPLPSIPPKMQDAIDRGVAHLKKQILEKGPIQVTDNRFGKEAQVGATALAGLAMLEARVSPQDPAIQKALEIVREAGPHTQMVYTLGSCLFFLNRLSEIDRLNDNDEKLIRTLALRLLAGQLPDGRWGYMNPPISIKTETELLEQLKTNTYVPQNKKANLPTHSMTQFAMLALWCSRKHGIPVRAPLLTCAARFHQTQYPDGTWDYNINNGEGKVCSDSNTCAGLIALAMEKTLREDKAFQEKSHNDSLADPKADERCEKAFAHLAKVIGRTAQDPTVVSRYNGKIIRADAWGDYYFLWCLERVAVIYDVPTIGGKDWYRWGSDVILANQRGDGSWLDRHGDVPDTCFAILFLTRANLARDLTESIRMRDGKVISTAK